MGQFRFLVPTSDFDGSVRFYRDVLGLAVHDAWDQDDGRGTILVATGTGMVELLEDDAADRSSARIAWEVDAVDALHRRLVGLDVPIVAAPADQPWGHRNLTFLDPNGVTITLFTVTAAH